MRFEFATATRIVFGASTLKQIGPLAAEMGRRALVVTSREGAREAPLMDVLDEQGIARVVYSVAGEPTVEAVQHGAQRAQHAACDMVISIGGGSVMDTGKAIAALMNNTGDLLDYLEVIGKAKALTQPSAPFIAIPTTAGTGAEVTRNAVLASPEHRVKVDLRSPLMLPRLALVDPELTTSLPPRSPPAQDWMRSRNSSSRSFPCGPIRCRMRSAVKGCAGRLAHFPELTRTATTRRHARTCHWRACWVGWRWPMRAWAQCMDSRA